MIAKGYLRGHEIEHVNNQWVYSDTKELTVINGIYQERACKHCGITQTEEGHDGCLGTLIGIMNACCGHGVNNEAYVQFLDKSIIRGNDARKIQDILKRNS